MVLALLTDAVCVFNVVEVKGQAYFIKKFHERTYVLFSGQTLELFLWCLFLHPWNVMMAMLAQKVSKKLKKMP